MAKIYFIDSENVGDSWIQLLSSMTGEDKMYVLYTDKSPYISYESLLQVIAYGSLPAFIKCHEGRNALDFQLVSELGFQMAQNPSEEFVIVSDDNGFDAVVRYWSDKHYRIRRIGRKFCRYASSAKKEGHSEECVLIQEEQSVQAVMERPLPVVYEAFRNSQETFREPEPAVVPETVVVPELTAEPEPTTEPEPVAAPESAAALKPAVVPEPTIAPESVVAPESAAAPDYREKNGTVAVPGEEQAEERKPSIQETIRAIVYDCRSAQPEKDAKCVYEMFFSLSMSTLTEVNTALKIFIGNEAGNDIYRELKEHQECRKALDDLFLPTQKERFLHYVGIVLERSELKELNAEELGKFLLRIPRKNLNSIRASMQKEFGHELGSNIYTVYKPHIKVLNKI